MSKSIKGFVKFLAEDDKINVTFYAGEYLRDSSHQEQRDFIGELTEAGVVLSHPAPSEALIAIDNAKKAKEAK